ncbi:MAG TPA: oxidoreductase [Bryobacteraceae bacterium]|nr:oxidoreductase [Bryobacteraceae bacterium]
MANDIISVGLIGYGIAGSVFHAPIIHAVPGLNLTCIVQRTGDSALKRYPDVRLVRTVDAMLADKNIRLVVVATPNDSHYELTKRCLLAGRDVVVDKPFTNTFREAQDLDRMARDAGRLLSVYQDRRYDGDFRTVQKLIGSGALGRLALFESHYDRYRLARRPGQWRESPGPGAGVMFDLGPHLVDQALVLFGMPEAISADVRIEREDAVVDDAFDIVLHYPKFRAALRGTMIAYVPRPRFVLNGTLGTFVKHGMDPQENALKAGADAGTPGWGEEPESCWGTLTLATENGPVRRQVPTDTGDYRLFYANVRDAILGKAPLDVTAEHAARVIQVLELARASSIERRWFAL